MIEKQEQIKYLNRIKSPADFKAIHDSEMPEVASEIRRELVRIVSQNGGHLSSNLGAVELTMAIHRVFDSPKDHVIFDVGHQSYVHKLLTGRYEEMETLRQSGGLCGFTNSPPTGGNLHGKNILATRRGLECIGNIISKRTLGLGIMCKARLQDFFTYKATVHIEIVDTKSCCHPFGGQYFTFILDGRHKPIGTIGRTAIGMPVYTTCYHRSIGY